MPRREISRENETQVENWWEVGYFPPDSPYWLKDGNGKPILGWGEDTNGDGKIDANDTVLSYLIDFTNPDMQNLMVNQAVALYASGLFDGIMLDWWNEDYATSAIGMIGQQQFSHQQLNWKRDYQFYARFGNTLRTTS